MKFNRSTRHFSIRKPIVGLLTAICLILINGGYSYTQTAVAFTIQNDADIVENETAPLTINNPSTGTTSEATTIPNVAVTDDALLACGPTDQVFPGVLSSKVIGDPTEGLVSSATMHFGSSASGARRGRVQFLYTAAELNAAGFTGGGKISSLSFMYTFASNPANTVTNLTMKMGCTGLSSLGDGLPTETVPEDRWDFETGLTQVGSYASVAPPAAFMFPPTFAWVEFPINEPGMDGFLWDGVSNLLVEFCTPDLQSDKPFFLSSSTTANNQALYLYDFASGDPDGCSYTAGKKSAIRPIVRMDVRSSFPNVNLSVSANSGTEAAGTAITVTATADAAVTGDQTIDLGVSGTGITGTDYSLSAATITILDGATTGTATFTIQDDAVIEGAETATLTISNPSAGITLGTTTTRNISITDNDSPGYSYAHSGGNTTVSETGTTDAFTVVLNAQPASDVVIDVSSGDTGEATVSPASLTFTAANWNTPQTVTVTGVDDALLDGTRNTGVTLSVNDAASNDAFDPLPNQTVIVSTTDDEFPEVNLSISATFGTEAAGTAITVTATATGAVTGDQTVDIAASGTGITGTDYTLSAGSITILDGATTGTVTFTIQDDVAIEGAETATLTISNPSAGITLGTTTARNVSITDNDTAGYSYAHSGGNTIVSETGTTDGFTIVLSAQPASDVVIDVSSGDTGEATISPASLTFTTANWNTPQTITVTGVDDAILDGTRNTGITLSINDAASNDAFDPLPNQTVIVSTTDDEFPEVSLSISATFGTEAAGTVITVTATATGAVTGDQTIDLSVSGTGITGTDYTLSAGTITILDGATTGTATFTILDDAAIEGAETATLTISNPSAGITLGATTARNVSITDNDSPGYSYAHSGGNTIVSETGTTDAFTVVLNAQPASDVVIDVSSGDTGEATVSPASLTFTAANWNTPQTVTATGVDDALLDGTRNTGITLSINDAASDDAFDPLSNQTVIVSTLDDELPEVSLSVSAAFGTEAAGTVITVTVTATGAVTGDQTVDIAANGTGITGTDYTLSAGSITILDGATTGTATFTILDDADIEGAETATLTISNPSAGIVLGATTTQNVTITDNDVAANPTVELSVSANAGTEAASTVITVTATTSQAVTGNQTVDIAASGAGITGTDYSLSAGTITILNGATTGTATFTILDDADIEGTETATLTISNPSAGLTLGAGTAQEITITDNEVVTVNLSISANSGTEAAGTVITATATTSTAVTGNQTVDIAASGTGITGTDYNLSAGTITILNGATTGTATFTILDDADIEGTETATLTISNPSAGLTLGAGTAQGITITDNEVAGFTIVESNGTTVVQESGTTDDFTVVLNVQPASNVTFNVTRSDVTEANVSPTVLTFTPANWNIPQTVIVTGLDDAVNDGDVISTVTVSPSSVDANFNGLADQVVSVTTINDDGAVNAVVELSVSANVGTEAASTVITVTATTSQAVTGNQTVDIAASGAGITGTDYSLSAGTITILNGATTGTATFTILDDADIEGTETATLTISNPSAGLTLGAGTAQEITITDNEVVTVNLSISANSGTEAAGTVITVTATATGAVTGDQTIDLGVSGTGITGTDYSLSAATITILDGATTGTVTFTIQDDAAIEGAETATLTISGPSAGITLGTTTARNVSITDNDSPGYSYAHSGGNTTVSETGTTDAFTVVLNAQPASDVVIDVSSGDTGEATVSPASLTFTAANWNTPQTVTATGVDDALLDGTRNTGITLSINDAASDDAFDPLSNQTVIVSTLDDELPEVSLSVSAAFGTEAAGTVITVTVTATGAVTGDQTVDIAANGTGITGTDYTLSAGSITILDGATTGTATFTILDDAAIEGAETATLTISNPSAGITLGTTTARNVSITDNDSPGYSYAHSGGNTIVSETGTTDGFTIVLSAQPASDVVIDVSSGDTGEATVSPASLTFTAANWNTPQTVTATGVDDALLDGTRNTGITLSINDAASNDAFDPLPNQTVIVSTTDDEFPEVNLSISATFGTEAAGTAITVTATATGAVTGDQTIDLSVSGTGITGTDYTLSAGTITILDGATTGTATFTILDDAAIEGAETATLTISNPSAGITLGTTTARNVSITDNDSPGYSYAHSGGNTIVSETGTTDAFTVVLNAQPASDVVIDVSSGDTGEATVSPASLTFTAANWNTPQTVTVTGVDDALLDGTRNTGITLSINDAASNDAFDPLPNQTVIVSTTDDELPEVNLSISATFGTEAAGTVITVTATATGAVTGDQTIDLGVSGTGITGTDYTLSASTITILDGATTGTVTFTIQDDAAIEGAETATLTISNPSAGITLGTTTARNISITDNDTADVTLSVSTNAASETDGTVVTITATSSVAVVGDQTVDIAASGAGLTGTDYSLSAGTITILNGATTGTATFTILDDVDIEGTETATLTISNPSAGLTLGATATQNITITDNDFPEVNLSVSTNTGTEAAGTVVTIIATASAAVTGNQTVDLVASGTGITGTDYSLSAGTITILDGATTGTATFTILDDADIEGAETATLTISNPSAGITLGATTTQTVVITDNDFPQVNLSVSANAGTEASGTVITVTATASVAVTGDQTVDLVASGTGITGTDYILSVGSITILNGETTGTVTFTIQDDALGEGNETATLTISNPSGGVLLGTTTSQDVIITDNDPIEINLSANANSGSEIGTVITLQVTAAFPVVGDQTVDLSVSGTDITFTDYALINPTITILDGQTSNTISFTIQDDTYVEDTETATITMSNPSAGLALGATATLDITIIDNDVAGFNITESDGNTSVSETGTTDDFLVKLDRRPTSDVVIDISSGDLGEAAVSPTQLTFTINTWNTAQTVTVTGVDDNFVDGDQNTTITLSINDANSNDLFDPVADQTLTVSTIDDDAVGFTVTQSDGNTSVSETGTTDEFTVVLSAQPASDVIIDVSSGDLGEATVSPASLTFTAANWNTPQTITVTGVDDVLIDGNQNTTVTLSINDAGSDDSFDPLADQTITVTTVDDDTPGFTIVESDGNTEVSETGTTDNFTVVLSSQPTSDVIINVSSGDTGEATVSLASLTFTAANWNTPQTITVTGVDDALVDGNQTTNITLSVNDGGSDDLFDSLADQIVSAITTDNDFPQVNLSVSANAGTEASGTVITVTATASAAVTGDQTVDLVASGTGITGTDYNLRAATITILDGATTGTATFTILDDADIEGNETATLTISNPSAGIMLGAITTQDITITDDDVAANPTVELSVSANAGTEAAGTVITVTATASAAVTGDQTIDLAVSGTGITGTDYSLSATTITILNGATTGTATFTILDDADIEGSETATLTISNPSAGITLGTTITQDITITDNDFPEVNLSVSPNTGTEQDGTMIIVTATASSEVVGGKTVDLGISGAGITSTDYALSSTILTIPDGETTGTTILMIVDDEDIEGTETATLTISNPSAGIILGTTTTQDIIITDDDYTKPDPTNVNTTIMAAPSTLVADGTSTSIITVMLSNANGDPLSISGGTVNLTTSGSASLSAVVDNNDGTYTATLTNTVVETVTITGQVDGEDITNNALVIFTPDLTDSDGDGVIDSDEDTNGNGDLTDDDTDGDGIPNYLDPDDDGDGVPTKDEDVNKDGDPTNDDTDDDGVPNHLDEDDDGDGKSTEEEGTGDSDGDGTPDYLDTVDKVEAGQILSPNDDGINDVFILEDIEKYPENMVSIFNRKGNLVFEIQGYNNNDKAWRGLPNTGFLTNSDRIVPNGTYFYVVDLNDGERPITGFLVLKR